MGGWMTRLEKLKNHHKIVLVVDDETDVREVVEEMIAEMGFQVKGVSNGKAAQDLIINTPVDLVISDVQMKGIDGLALAHWIRDRFPRLPLALMTAFPSDDLKSLVRKKVVKCLLRKPFQLNDLQGMVQNLTR
jgi:DNA-binding NtrC family response regulator